jgi:hypothetical protein
MHSWTISERRWTREQTRRHAYIVKIEEDGQKSMLFFFSFKIEILFYTDEDVYLFRRYTLDFFVRSFVLTKHVSPKKNESD